MKQWRKYFKPIIAVFAIATMLLCDLSVEIFANTSVPYLDATGAAQTKGAIEITDAYLSANNYKLVSGWYVVNGTLTTSSVVDVSGDVHIILADNCVWTTEQGIHVAEGNEIAIYAQSVGANMGQLIATAPTWAAAIGGHSDENGGVIVINGGNITATGSVFGSAIGGGTGADNSMVVINGGEIQVQAGTHAAGIGGGHMGAGGIVMINGGEVEAIAGGFGAAVGGGNDGAGGIVLISGANTKVKATGTFHVPAIGVGTNNDEQGTLMVADGAKVEVDRLEATLEKQYGTCTMVINGTETTYNNDLHILYVENGVAGSVNPLNYGIFATGTIIDIKGTGAGRFVDWTTSSGGTIASATSVETTVVMPANTVMLTANYVADLEAVVVSYPADQEFDNDYTVDNVLASTELGSKATLRYNNGTTKEVDVTWAVRGTYNATAGAENVFEWSVDAATVGNNINNVALTGAVTIKNKAVAPTPIVTAPSITTQPENASIKVGETAAFAITATGTDLTYQWQIDRNDGKGFVNIANATSASYTTSTVTKACDGSKYQCIVSNSTGTVKSNVVTLTVTEQEHVHDYAEATCTVPKTCKGCGATEGTALGHIAGTTWEKDADNHWHTCSVSGCGAVIESTKAAHTYDHKCAVCGYEKPASTPVVTAPSITTQPENASIKVGETATFVITATGTDLTYQWQIDRNDGNGFVNITNATSTSYTTSTVAKDCDGFKYQCIVSNSAGTVKSNVVTLTVTEQEPATETPAPSYTILEGKDESWTQGTTETVTVRADGDFAKFTGVKVNDTLIDAKNYTAVSGSTVVTLKEEYLKTLEAGTYKLTIVFTDGACSTNFVVEKAVQDNPVPPTEPQNPDETSPKTGETAGFEALGIFALLGMFIVLKKKSRA